MAAAEKRDQQFFDDGFLAYDHLAQFGAHVVVAALEFFDRGEFFGGEGRFFRFNQANGRILRHEMRS
jgi:hypothetical protein